jgi:hypothetical protein
MSVMRTHHCPTRPRRVRRALGALAAAVLVAGPTACGSDDSGDAGDGSGTVSESSPGPSDDPSGSGGSTSSDDASQAVSVAYRQTGGLRAVDIRLSYSDDGPPPEGVTAKELDQVLEAASDPALRDVELEPVPKNTCCDRQEYTVVITYADGTAETFRTLDGLQQPAVFEDLLGMLG